MTIITSRQSFLLAGLGFKRLNVLSSAEACVLLLRIAPRIETHAKLLADICGNLPLALRLTASMLAVHEDIDVEEYIHQLRQSQKRLVSINSAKHFVDAQGVGASIELSYQLLDSENQWYWRSLAVFPGKFDVAAASAIWQLGIEQGQEILGKLCRYNLVDSDQAFVPFKKPITKADEIGNSYYLHDLTRIAADSYLTSQERLEVSRHHAIYYQGIIREANQLYKRGGVDVSRGLALFDKEWINIQSAQIWAASHLDNDDKATMLCSQMANDASDIIFLRLSSTEKIQWHQSALRAARVLHNRKWEANHLSALAIAYFHCDDYEKAKDLSEQALHIHKELQDFEGESSMLNNLGLIYTNLGKLDRAIMLLNESLKIDKKISNSRGQGHVLINLGLVYEDLNEYPKSIELYEEALALYRKIGYRRGEALALGNLGSAYCQIQDLERARENLKQQWSISYELGDRRSEAYSLRDLGVASFMLGNIEEAVDYNRQALAICRSIGNRFGEFLILENLGEIYAESGISDLAIQHLQQALSLACEIRYRRGEGSVSWQISKELQKRGELAEAITLAKSASAIFTEVKHPKLSEVASYLSEVT